MTRPARVQRHRQAGVVGIHALPLSKNSDDRGSEDLRAFGEVDYGGRAGAPTIAHAALA